MMVYALIDPRDDAVRYVGQTVKPLEYRYDVHANSYKQRGAPTRNVAWIKHLKSLGMTPDVAIVEDAITDIDTLDEREMYWIAFFREVGETLNNHTDGGDGVRRLDAEASERRRASLRKSCGVPRTEAQASQIARMHLENTGRARTDAELTAARLNSAAARSGLLSHYRWHMKRDVVNPDCSHCTPQ